MASRGVGGFEDEDHYVGVLMEIHIGDFRAAPANAKRQPTPSAHTAREGAGVVLMGCL
ncbi:hypothetical protein ACFWPK_33620 [Nocardia sp. NPDC058519]|uniref:hypothetical protein n=1 Tax=Nocardia sp. NPDC058519 TaxID=3346535 RepID=UPI003649AD83